MCPATTVVGTAATENGRSDAEPVESTAPADRPVAVRPHGFRLTLRHQAILVAYFALLFALVLPFVETSGRWAYFNATLAALLVSPWLLASLMLVFDRPGPLKHWLAPVLLAFMGPALALSYDLAALSEWIASGTSPRFGTLFVVNMFFLTAFGYYLRQVGPTSCPSCSRKGLIPVYYLWGSSARTRWTRWCAACGATFWRRRRSESWQRERRRV